jgi:hypothetical protein
MPEGSGGGALKRAWRGWCGFWFRPADPTPLALMRIVAGLLTLYVHIAYCLDLNAFFGNHGWYERSLAERAYREYPIFLPPEDPEKPRDLFLMPSSVEMRRTLREFVDTVNSKSDGQQVLGFLMELPTSEGLRAEMIRYFNALSLDYSERDAELVKMVLADPKDDKNKVALPTWLLEQSKEARESRRADIHRLFDVLPQDAQKRSWIVNMITLWSPRDCEMLRKLVNDMNSLYPDSAQRAREWDYLVFWGVPRHLTYTTGHWYYSPFYYVEDPRILWFIHALHLLVIVLFTIGFCTRITSVLTWFAALAYVQRNPIILFGQDTMMNLCLFYLMMSPCGAVWSVDAFIARYRRAKRALAEGRTPIETPVAPMVSAGFVIRILQVHYCFMYLSAGLAKLKGPSWWNGTAPWATMNNPEFSPVHITWFRDFLSFLCQPEHRFLWEAYMNFGVIFTLAVEIGFPFCVWTRLRPIFVAGAILLHLGIALNMGLHVFSLFMFTLLLCWMTPEALRRVFARPPVLLPKVRVRFNGRAEPQRKAASLVYALDVWGQAELQDRSAKGRSEEAESVEVATDRSTAVGSSGLRAALRALPVAQPVVWVIGPLFALLFGSWFGGAAAAKSESKKTVGV